MLTKQKILLVSYENDGYAIAELARYLIANNYDVFMIVGDQHSLIKRRGWESRCIEYNIQYETISSAFGQVKERKSGPDWEWLKKFEKTELFNKSFNELMLTDASLSHSHHNRRPYYKAIEKQNVYLIAECLVRLVLHRIVDYAPDAIVTIERNYFIKNTAAQIGLARNIPVYAYVSSRIGKFGIWLDEFGMHLTSSYGDNSVEKIEHKCDDYSDEFKKSFNNYKDGKKAGLYKARSHGIRASSLNSWRILITFFKKEFNAWKKLLLHAYDFLRGRLYRWSTPLSGSFPRVRIFSSLILIRNLRVNFFNIYDNLEVNLPYILFPLHVLPESSTLTLGPEYYEIDLVRRLSHRIPANMCLIVKENPSMVGLRTRREIKLLKDLPNVIYCSHNIDTKGMIREASGLAGISGTALLEAAMLGKPALAFGIPEFGSAIKYKGYNDVGAFVEACQKNNQVDEYQQKAVQYLNKVSASAIPALPIEIGIEAKNDSEVAYDSKSKFNLVAESLLFKLYKLANESSV